MEVRPGYKQTEVGVIPDGWEVRGILSTVRIANGQVDPQREPFRSMVLVAPDHIESGTGRLLARKTAAEQRAISGKYAFDAGDIVYSKIRPYLRKAILADFAGLCSADMYPLKPACDVVGGFILPSLLADRFTKYAESVSVRSGMPKINRAELAEFIVALPPVPEQRAIAAALSDVDALLGGLDRLIAKKRDLKQAAMQQLLTGQTRLPGFHGEWEVKRLGDLGTFLKGNGVKKDDARSGNLPCIRYGEIYTHHNDYVRSFNSWISPVVAGTATPLKQGDLLFAGSGETKEEIGKCVAFVDSCQAYAGGDIVILRLSAAHPMFMGYYCNTPSINAQKASKGQGDAVVHVSAAALSSILVVLPSLPEQTAIAAVLSDLDAELAALEARREKTRALKQGMMQELITGQTRLVAGSTESKIIALPHLTPTQPEPKKPAHNWAFNEAVVISVLADEFGSTEFPLGRMRCTKLAYLLHRHVEREVKGYLKKAAGPYNPATRYAGPERIAQQNGYIKRHKRDQYEGFIAAENVAQARGYFLSWYGQAALDWLEQFRHWTNERLELVTTVDMAADDIEHAGKQVRLEAVKSAIREHPEWEAKLDRPAFTDERIAVAIDECQRLFST